VLRTIRERRSPSGRGGDLVDPVTGLGDRSALGPALSALVDGRRPGALALVAVDGYQALHLRRGPGATATLLAALGTALHDRTAGRSFHLGDGSFAVVLPSAGDLVAWADELLAELGALDPEVTVSVGTARAEVGVTAAGLEARATTALRRARRHGNGSSADFGQHADAAPDEVTPAQASALDDLLSAGGLKVHYQPIVDLRDGRTVGVEALVRPQATSELRGPAEAFEVARRLNLVAELDAVCRFSIFAEGPGFDLPRDARLHVNVSPLSLGHRSLSTPALRRQLERAGLEPHRLVLELREDHDAEPEVTDRELRRLEQAGVTLLLDQVGSGAAGLRQLGSGRFQACKLSHEVLAAAPTSTHAEGIVEAVCAFARHTGTQVIAGGVADEDLLRFVQYYRLSGHRDWRIPAAQGYVLGRPAATMRAGRLVLAQKQAAASHG
jgi:EAL domain-containing protein (putative c-di-GMP-specific phosphodiesterase class I)